MSFLTRIPAAALASRRERGKSMHQAVMSLFPETLPGEADQRRAESNILFMETGEDVLVRSDLAPTRLPSTAVTREIAETELPTTGATITFRLAANAVKRQTSGGITPIEDVESWVQSRLDGALGQVAVLDHHRRLTTSGRSALQIDLIDGVGVVEDAAALGALMRAGVGRAKAYGCGLLLVARAA